MTSHDLEAEIVTTVPFTTLIMGYELYSKVLSCYDEIGGRTYCFIHDRSDF